MKRLKDPEVVGREKNEVVKIEGRYSPESSST
jgi:hypothetical protein